MEKPYGRWKEENDERIRFQKKQADRDMAFKRKYDKDELHTRNFIPVPFGEYKVGSGDEKMNWNSN